LERAATIDSTDAELYAMMGKYRFLMQEYDRALLLYNQALSKDVFNPKVYFFKGITYKEMGDTARAIGSFQTAVEQDPNYYEAYMQIGVLMQKKKDKLAQKYLDNAIKVKPNSEEALYAKAYNLQESNQYKQAAEVFRQIISLNYKNDAALYALGYCQMMQDSIAEAYKMFDLAIKVNPTYAEAYYKKGVCAEQLGKKDEAKTLFVNALNINSEYKPAKDALARMMN
jgi:tetratricopeptide (TPR) repeat protein